MGLQAHKLHHRRTTVKRLWRNYEDLPKISGKSIEKTAGLNYTRHIRIFAAAGCWQNIQILDAASQAALGGKTALKGWYKALEDLVWLTQLGLNMLLPLVLCLAGCWWAVERWNWPEWLFLPAVLLGLAAGAQNFWVFCKERLDRSKKEKNHRVGFNSHQ